MKIEVRCSDHPRYQAKRYPRADCFGCKALWHVVRDGGFVFHGVYELTTLAQYKKRKELLDKLTRRGKLSVPGVAAAGATRE